jgi:putative addiction module component (TIGR02574 family)
MIKTDELINEAVSLPVEIRAQLIEKLLQSLNPSRKKIDTLWAKEAERRVKDIKTGAVDTIPGEKVFQKIRDRIKT